jgi:hydroxymethylglutaryl-CoA synthase
VTAGIAHWGAYLPAWRLDRESVVQALGASAGNRKQRAVASHDEDTTSMAVEAGRRALAGTEADWQFVALSTTSPSYVDKTNASAVRAALGLGDQGAAFDLNGSVRSAFGAVEAGLAWGQAGRAGIVAVSDMRNGLPGGPDEIDGADAAAAFAVTSDNAVLEVVARSSVSQEFLDRWRSAAGEVSSRWEERFGQHAYIPLGRAAAGDALDRARLSADAIDHVIVAGPHERACRALASSLACRPDTLRRTVTDAIGNAGAAQGPLELCAVLESAAPDETILFISLADGADALVLRTTEELRAEQVRRAKAGVMSIRELLGAGRRLSYPTFLTWRGKLVRETPRRPEPPTPAAPPALRSEQWKFAFVASRCGQCQARHLPPARICHSCHAVDEMNPDRLADVPATVATYTVDRLAYSLSPPIVAAVVDFDGGGRFACELTDVDAGEVHIGLRVQMTFRRLYTTGGVHNYFWKAKPAPDQARG